MALFVPGYFRRCYPIPPSARRQQLRTDCRGIQSIEIDRLVLIAVAAGSAAKAYQRRADRPGPNPTKHPAIHQARALRLGEGAAMPDSPSAHGLAFASRSDGRLDLNFQWHSGLSTGWDQFFESVAIQRLASSSVAKFPTRETGSYPVLTATVQRPSLIIFE
jgi:hypothetical protein